MDWKLLAWSSPKFSVKQHRSAARELFFFLQVGGVFVIAFYEAVFALNDPSKYLVIGTRT